MIKRYTDKIIATKRRATNKLIKILFIDNYDSFANTIAAYFRKQGAEVIMYKSDCSIDIIDEFLEKEKPDFILLGPGPSGPKQAGNYLEIIDKYHKFIPLFGICLGFQAIMEYFGVSPKPLNLSEVVHGDSVSILNDGKTIFKEIKKNQKFARYNSLGVYEVPACFEISAKTNVGINNNSKLPIIMAARHKSLPIECIQFHPESILSMENDAGMKLIGNVISNNTFVNNVGDKHD
ncbi:aminodeoxychorismate/anthranilate synthase component II [Candidatus Woesearchaeota archaeon]|jgi:anthranilate synthase/aminodeoxychorismate synthase-like glutamine amidotransferase|nr:aminodeoxychorismate/anthranilate synthase component II [Candidatus Woesearchaeota archaeon]